MFKITSPIPPSVNNYLRQRVQRGRNGKIFVQVYKSAEAIAYEKIFSKIVVEEISKQNWVKPDKLKYIIVEATYYFPRLGFDTNNHWKLPLDVFTTVDLYEDDSKVVERVNRIYIDKENPRIEFAIYEAPFVGVFNDEFEFELFKNSNCILCSKNINTCGVLKRALENKILHDEIKDSECKKIKIKKIKKT